MTTFDIEKSQVENFEKWKQEHDKQIRADAIEPIKAIIQESEKMMWHSSKTLKKIQEQLKELTE